MKFDYYKDSFANYKLSVKILITTIIILSLLCCALTIISLKMTRKTRVVLVPPKLTEPVFVGDEMVDKEYLLSMGRYALYLIATFNYKSVERQFNNFLELTAPESFSDIKAKLIKKIALIKKQRITQAFIPEDFKVMILHKEIKIYGKTKTLPAPPKGKITVKGLLLRRISSGPIIDSGVYEYTIYYLIRFGKFQVTAIKVVPIKKNVKLEEK